MKSPKVDNTEHSIWADLAAFNKPENEGSTAPEKPEKEGSAAPEKPEKKGSVARRSQRRKGMLPPRSQRRKGLQSTSPEKPDMFDFTKKKVFDLLFIFKLF